MKISILSIILAFLLSGCVMDDYGNHCPEPEDGAGYITVSFKMVTSNVSRSRADDNQNHYEINSEWSMFEDLIKADEFAFFIFADKNNEGGKFPLVLKMTDIRNSTDQNMVITGAPGHYTVTAKIPKESLGYSITPGNSSLIYFRMVVLANVPADADDFPNYDEFITTSDALASASEEVVTTMYQTFMAEIDKGKFTLSSIYTISSSSNSISALIEQGAAIPMYGVKDFAVSEEKLYTSRPEERIWIGEISMLRSLAKIKVIDKTSVRNEKGLPRIESISVTGRTSSAYILPNNALYYKNGWQVETARPANNVDTSNPVTPLGYLNPVGSEVAYFGYIPEQGIKYNMPQVNIRVVFDIDENNLPINQKTFNIPLDAAILGSDILRNHIYTLEVDIETSQLNLNVAVNDWRTLTYEYEY